MDLNYHVMPKWYEILFLSIHLRFQDIFLQIFHFIIDIKPFDWEIQMGNNSSLGRKLTFECADLKLFAFYIPLEKIAITRMSKFLEFCSK